jgi:hypothetical protein
MIKISDNVAREVIELANYAESVSRVLVRMSKLQSKDGKGETDVDPLVVNAQLAERVRHEIQSQLTK